MGKFLVLLKIYIKNQERRSLVWYEHTEGVDAAWITLLPYPGSY